MSDNDKRSETPMTQGFQHQNPAANFTVPKSAASPQHGQKADKTVEKLKENRSFQPRPAH